VSTTDGLTTGFAVADALPNPLVVKLLAIGCDNGGMLRASKVAALTDPLLFRCPEKIIASFPVRD
jgi:hypothetical protein